MKKLLLLCCCILVFVITVQAQSPGAIIIPLGGNAWVKAPAQITDDGLTNWSAGTAQVYFRTMEAQSVQLSLRLKVAQGASIVEVWLDEQHISKKISNTTFDTVAIGEFKILKPGYVKVELRGISKSGAVYADVSDLVIKGIGATNQLTYVKAGSSFHFGRRGPSVHLRYSVPDEVKNDVKWFYNEITVPVGKDIIGSYFMADGFGEGYFGMQVNSATERRVLFSVWSPFKTDDPKNIPDSMKVGLIKKGANVITNEFGNEGSGGQSRMIYPWAAGKTYGFLLRAEPDAAKGSTTFTAWFKDVAAGKWFLIAGFSCPKTVKSLTSLYSFVENFEPDNGDQTRTANFNNEWIANSAGQWLELTRATYTGDATANSNYRKDYAGGINSGGFYLQNGGFFSDFVQLKQTFNRTAVGKQPNIALSQLPQK